MLCPVDGTTLLLAERQGVEIDYCPDCRGVWLDRGELDKLMQKEPEWEDRGRRWKDDDDHGHGRKPKKRKGFLSEIFEFGD